MAQDDTSQALDTLKQIIDLAPDDFETHTNIGVLLRRLGDFAGSEKAYRAALAINPKWPAGLFNLGNLFKQLERHSEAIALYRRAVSIKPDYAEAFNNLASSLLDLQQNQDAMVAGKEAVRLDPNSILPLINLGRSLNRLARYEEAAKVFSKALALDPGQFEAMRGLAHALSKTNRVAQSIALYERVVAGCPQAGPLERFNISLLHLLNRNYEAGWKDYDSRLEFEKYASYRQCFPAPSWNGEPLKGAKIMLYSEQGRGDAIQCIRYVPMVAALGGEVVVECYPELASLLGRAEGVSAIEIKGEGKGYYDHYVSLMSLPRVFATTADSIPASTPYLAPLARRLDKWRSRISDDGRQKIGLVWRGSPTHGDDMNRSLQLAQLVPLFGLENATIYGLQKEVTSTDQDLLKQFPQVTLLGEELDDFEDTAAVMQQLDLVITVDTAAAHLAGALGKPVWILLPFAPDWRWMLDREDSPWYPTARLFRQGADRDWGTVVSDVVNHLGPVSTEAMREQALRLIKAGRLDEAKNAFGAVLRREPEDVETLCNLGVVLRRMGQLENAEAAYRRAIKIKPDWAAPLFNLGNLLNQMGRFDDAVNTFIKATDVDPDYGDAYNNLAFTLAALRRGDEALAVCEKLLKIYPERSSTFNNLGKALSLLGRYEESVEAYERALELQPNMADALNGLGYVLRQMNKLEAAEQAYLRAIEFQHGNAAQEKFNLSILQLLTGRYNEGWKLHEWRLHLGEHAAYRNRFPDADWDGRDLNGEEILLYCEQGRGDAIQFIRYAPMVAERGGRVVVECHDELGGLLARADGVSEIEKRGRLEQYYKNHVSLMSLANVFQTTLETIPGKEPYLAPLETRQAIWAKKFSRFRKHKVAVAWQGAVDHGNDHNRSIRLDALAPLLKSKAARFFNFQREIPERDEGTLATISNFNHVATDFADFDDTAAALEQMDLLITVDTAIAHLGGALGIPTWVLLPYSPDWRWLLDRDDSPWYPSIRLFRQGEDRDWATVVTAVEAELNLLF